MKKVALAFLALIGLTAQTGARTQISTKDIQPATVNGVMVNVLGKGWVLATLDSSLLLDTTGATPVLKAVPNPAIGPVFVDWVTPTGTIDGVNAVFTLPSIPTPVSSLELVRNGLVQDSPRDFALSGSTVTFVPTSIPDSGDTLKVRYRR